MAKKATTKNQTQPKSKSTKRRKLQNPSKKLQISPNNSKITIKKSLKIAKTTQSKTSKKNYINNFIPIELPCFFTTIKCLTYLKQSNLILISSLDTLALLSFKQDNKNINSSFSIDAVANGYLENEKINKIIELKNGHIAVAGENHLNIYKIENNNLILLFYYRYTNPSSTVQIFETTHNEVVNCKVNGLTKFKYSKENKKYEIIGNETINSDQFYETFYDKKKNILNLFYLDDVYQYDLTTFKKIKNFSLSNIKFSEDKNKTINFKVFGFNSEEKENDDNFDYFVYYYENSLNIYDNDFNFIDSIKLNDEISYMRIVIGSDKKSKITIGDKKSFFYIYEINSLKKLNKIYEFKFGETSILAINQISNDRIILNIDHDRFAIFDFKNNVIECIQNVKNSRNMRKGILLENKVYLTGYCNGFILAY